MVQFYREVWEQTDPITLKTFKRSSTEMYISVCAIKNCKHAMKFSAYF